MTKECLKSGREFGPWILVAFAAAAVAFFAALPVLQNASAQEPDGKKPNPLDSGPTAGIAEIPLILDDDGLQICSVEFPSLDKIVSKADAIIAGTIDQSEGGLVIVVERIFKGADQERVMKYLRGPGLRFGGRTRTWHGAHVVAFPSYWEGELQIYFHQDLDSFDDETEYRSVLGLIEESLAGKTLPAIFARIRSATDKARVKQDIQGIQDINDDQLDRLTMDQVLEVARKISALKAKYGDSIPVEAYAELIKMLESFGINFRKKITTHRWLKGEHPGTVISDAADDIERIGSLPAFTGLMEVYVDLLKIEHNARLVEAIGSMNPAENHEILRKSARENERDALDSRDKVAVLRSLMRVADSLRVNAVIGEHSSIDEVITAAGRLRSALLARIATDHCAKPGRRTAALKALQAAALEALTLGDLMTIAGNASLPHPLRAEAVMMLGSKGSAKALPLLGGMLESTPTSGDGPEPSSGWCFSRVSGFTLKVKAADAIAQIGDPSGIPALMRALSSKMEPGSDYRPWIGRALAALKAVEAISEMEKALKENPEMDRMLGMMSKAIAELKTLKGR